MRASLPERHARRSLTVPALLIAGLFAGSALAAEPAAQAPAKPVAAPKPAPAASAPANPTAAPVKAVPAPAKPVSAPANPAAAKPVSAPANPVPAPAKAVANPVPAPAKAVANPGKPATTPAAPVKVTSGPAKGAPTARTVSASPMVGSVPPAAARPGSSPVAHLDERLTYQYNALGRRDPFQSLVSGAFVGADVGGEAPPDVGGIKVVGIVWGTSDQFALIEDARGNSMVLRRGDKVQNGFVEGLRRDALIVNLTADGQSQTVVIPLTKKGDQNASR